MKFSYPVKDIKSIEDFYKLRQNGGFYPVGKSNVWHGGIHIEGKEKEICAIADGEIIACRIPQKYIVEKQEGKKIFYSNGFVLIRHKYEYIADDDTKKEFIFYSLYNHLLPYKKEGKKDDKIFDGKDIPIYLRKNEDGYEVISTTLNLRSSTKKEGTQGEIQKILNKGALLKKGTNTEDELKKEHWTYNTKYKKIIYESGSEKEEGFVSTGSQFVKEIAIIEYDNSQYPFDTVKKTNVPLKSGDIIGYTGICGTAKYPDYSACHIEVFTVDEKNLNDFLDGKVKNEDGLRRFFRFDADVTLQKNYPIKVKGSWEVKLLEKGANFSKIEIQRKKKTVDYDNLTYLGNTYSIKKEKFAAVNGIFDGVLAENSILSWVETIKDSKGKTTGQRIAAIKFNQKPNIFWISNNKTGDKKKGDIFELEEDQFEKLYDSEKEPDTQDIKVEKGTVIEGSLKKLTIDTKVWYQLESNKQKGWMEDGTKGCTRISAYKWKEWGFAKPKIVTDDPDDFIFDGNEKGTFMKTIVEKIDKDANDEITEDELREAVKDKTIAKELATIIMYHKTDWAGPKTADLYAEELGKMVDKAINEQTDEKRKKRLEDLKPDRLTILKERSHASGFWNDIDDELNSKTEVFYFHPIAFVEQMKRMEEIIIIRLIRKWEYDSGTNSNSSTTGSFTIDDYALSGYILEPHGVSTTEGGKDKRVPAGTYSMVWHTSIKYPKDKYVSKGQKKLTNGFPKIYNNDVSTNRAILIHVGNTGADTEGCLLPGSGLSVKTINNNKKVTGITDSTSKFYELIELIESKGINNIKIIITEEYEDYK